jgi:hypothetical protein
VGGNPLIIQLYAQAGSVGNPGEAAREYDGVGDNVIIMVERADHVGRHGTPVNGFEGRSDVGHESRCDTEFDGAAKQAG